MRQWQQSTNGADWTGIVTAMNALQALHQSTCYIEAVPDGGDFVGSLTIRVLLQRKAPGPGLDLQEVGVAGEWPSTDGKSVEAFLMALLVAVDELALKEFWVQKELPALPL